MINISIIYTLGMRLMALRGLSTRTVLMAERLSFSTSRQYSSALGRVGKLSAGVCNAMLSVKGKQSCPREGGVLVAKQSKGERCREV